MKAFSLYSFLKVEYICCLTFIYRILFSFGFLQKREISKGGQNWLEVDLVC